MASDEPASPPPPPDEPPVDAGVPHLGFFVGAELYALPLTRLRQVAQLTRLRRIPGAPKHVAGLVNLRGEIVCALDVHAMLGASAPPSENGFLIALQDFSYPVGLIVDSIANIFAIDLATLLAPPDTWPSERAACVAGTTSVSMGWIGVLDLDRMVNR